MLAQDFHYRADGLDMAGRLCLPEGATTPLPAVLVFPEAFGLGSHAISRAERLAELGFAALACDLHGNRERHMHMPTVLGLVMPIRKQPERLLERGRVPLDLLRAHPAVDGDRISALGFCLGGTITLELVRNGAPICNAIGFHAGLAPVSDARIDAFGGRILMAVGADDPHIPADERTAFEQEMRASGARWQLNVYGGVVHSFTDPEADERGDTTFYRHDPHADGDSWAAAMRLLGSTA